MKVDWTIMIVITGILLAVAMSIFIFIYPQIGANHICKSMNLTGC